MVGAEPACVVPLFGAACDGDRLESHRAGELDSEVSESADAQDGDAVTGPRPSLA